MFKRIFTVLFMVVLLLTSPPVMYADVIYGNDFYLKHESEIQKLDRSRFQANGYF